MADTTDAAGAPDSGAATDAPDSAGAADAADSAADGPTRSSGPGRWAASAVAALVGVAAVAGSIELGIGTPANPDAGMWPCVAGVLLAAFGTASTVRDARAGDGPVATVSLRLVLGIAALAGYILAFRAYGLLLPTPVFLLFWVRAVAADGWRPAALTAVFGTAGFWLVFAVLLQVPLPIGPFGL